MVLKFQFYSSAFILITISFFSCSYYLNTEYTPGNTIVSDVTIKDSSLIKIIQPFYNQLNETMQAPVGILAHDMPLAKPESLLGNFIVDALFNYATQVLELSLDFAVTNYGGIRIPQLDSGIITTGKIFELLPFENFLTVITLDGKTTLQLITVIAEHGGWPVNGITFEIVDGKPEQIVINNQPFNVKYNYRILMNDYMANGGDNLFFLKDVSANTLGITMRDALFAVIAEQTAHDKLLHSTLSNRIRHAE